MASNDLTVQRSAGVLYLTLNRPEKLNALSPAMLKGLMDELRRAADDREVGAVVLTGAGRGFCSGGDVAAMGARNEGHGPGVDERVRQLRHAQEAVLLLHEIPMVTIAAINGMAVGAGLGLALACDLRIAADTAGFATAFARVGFSGDFGVTYLLTQLVGTAKARELFYLGERVSVEEAARLGIVNRVVPAGALAEETRKLAERIAQGPRVAYAHMKSNLNLALTDDLRGIIERECLTQTLTGRTEDHREAVQAFLEKREPKFQGN